MLPTLSFETVFDLLHVDFETGELFWKPRPVELFTCQRTCNAWNSQFVGAPAFTADDGRGYRRGSILGRSYLAHRIIWLLAHGSWPPEKIDHINGTKWDNRLSNLRAVSNEDNCKNRRLSSNNKSGVSGVCWKKSKGKWAVKITVNRKIKHLGYFSEFDDAVIVRKAAEIRFGFHPNHGRAA